jgi:transposase
MQKRRFSKAFKLDLLAQVESGRPVAELAREHEIAPTQIYAWQKQHQQMGEDAFAGHGNICTPEAKVSDLERKVGQLTMELEFLKKANTFLRTSLGKANPKGKKS